VRIGSAEVDRIAAFLGLECQEFLRAYTLRVGARSWWLTEQPNLERWCVFLARDADGRYACRINPVKPDQCRGFPAKWRNEDSFQTCAGLRALMRLLDREAGAANPSPAAPTRLPGPI